MGPRMMFVADIVRRLFVAASAGKADPLFFVDAEQKPRVRFDEIRISDAQIEYWYRGEQIAYQKLAVKLSFERGDKLFIREIDGSTKMEIHE